MCFKSDDYFVDIGIIEDYRKLCNEHYKLINFKNKNLLVRMII